jgi:hypothetical protein
MAGIRGRRAARRPISPALANACLRCAAGMRLAEYFARAAKGYCHMAGCADDVARASDARRMPASAARSSRKGLPNLGWIIRGKDEDRQFGRFCIGMKDSALDFLGSHSNPAKPGRAAMHCAQAGQPEKAQAKKQKAKAWMRPHMHDPVDQIAKG